MEMHKQQILSRGMQTLRWKDKLFQNPEWDGWKRITKEAAKHRGDSFIQMFPETPLVSKVMIPQISPSATTYDIWRVNATIEQELNLFR